ncbi:hypothetical protein BAC1_00533 [uncultured bacterium]|nr:hypothetical protein BAC1_00533 [uncultured bacterium]
MGGVKNASIKEEPMTKIKDNLLEVTINLVIALAVLSTVAKVTL